MNLFQLYLQQYRIFGSFGCSIRNIRQSLAKMASGLLPDTATLAQLIGRLGAIPAHHVVIVSAGTTVGDFSATARVYWTFKTAGHRTVSILDGGMAAWAGEGRATEAGGGGK